jgi:hypothetical protein
MFDHCWFPRDWTVSEKIGGIRLGNHILSSVCAFILLTPCGNPAQGLEYGERSAGRGELMFHPTKVQLTKGVAWSDEATLGSSHSICLPCRSSLPIQSLEFIAIVVLLSYRIIYIH